VQKESHVPGWKASLWVVVPGIALLLAIAAWWARHYSLEPSRASHPFRIAYHSLPPQQGVGTDLVGAANEIFQEACRRRHVPVKLVDIYEEPADALQDGRIDLVPVVFDTPKDRKIFYISDPWIMDSGWMVSLESSGISDPEHLSGKRVWYQDNIRHSSLAHENFSGAHLEAQLSFTAAVEGVCRGNADAALISPVQAGTNTFFEDLPACRGQKLKFSPLPHGRIWFGVGALRSNAAASRAADAIRNEIGRMAEDGTLGRIYLKRGLDPNNAATVIQFLTVLQERGFYLTIVVFVLVAVLVLLSWQGWRLRKARMLADMANAAKTEFLANMSHEVRTPLNGVIGMTRLALDSPMSADQRELLGIAAASADALLSVVDEILDFSKLEAGKLRIEDLEIDLYHLVESSTKAFALPAHEKGLELICDIAPDCAGFVFGDPARLRQVIFNLLNNAIKFTAAGEITLKVAVDASESEPVLHFFVKDTGIGISQEKHAHIFEPFSQADSSTTRKFGGTGLGLSISRQLVELMGGKIWLESAESRGACFHFNIPLRPSGRRSDVAANIIREDWRGRRVLLVDDNATARGVLERILRVHGLDVTWVSNGESALAELARQRDAGGQDYSVLIVDSEMPQMDGFELASQAHDRFGLGRAIVMMLTSDKCSFTAGRCRELGIVAHLLKPLGQMELLSATSQVMRVQTAPVAAKVPASVSNVVHQGKASPGWLVLLAEDNLVNQKVALAMLQRAGHTVELAENGRDAVDLSRQKNFDVILMDIQMPEMDGLEATRIIRNEELQTGARVRIVAMTAHAIKGDSERFMAAGMDGYIAKPFQQRELFKVIETVMLSVPAPEPGVVTAQKTTK